MIPQLIGLGVARLVCFFRGHKRGKRIGNTAIVQCPRCGAEWVRMSKVKE